MDKFEFTKPELEETKEILFHLRQIIGTSLKEDDEQQLREQLITAIDEGHVQRDIFGLNPILQALRTAQIAVDEIGLKREGVLATMLFPLILNGHLTIDNIKSKFGEGVARIVHGLVKIHNLYKKNPVIESENFRNLLISFSEDMRVILIMIADRVNLMRQIRDTQAKDAQKEVSEEANYLYAPLAHKLGLYKLKSELEDLSLKYL